MLDVTHKLAYLSLAAVSVAACFGVDKGMLGAFAAVAYFALAFSTDHEA